LIPDAKPVRSCESLATISLPNTTIESAAVDPANAGICRVVAIATHPPAGDKVRIFLAFPVKNWNGRLLGVGGGGFSGGSPMVAGHGIAICRDPLIRNPVPCCTAYPVPGTRYLAPFDLCA
jgi:hypothetical protein